jgi:hypothetical protein
VFRVALCEETQIRAEHPATGATDAGWFPVARPPELAFANTLKYLDGQPLIGVNPDPKPGTNSDRRCWLRIVWSSDAGLEFLQFEQRSLIGIALAAGMKHKLVQPLR